MKKVFSKVVTAVAIILLAAGCSESTDSTDSMNFVKENGKWKIKFSNL